MQKGSLSVGYERSRGHVMEKDSETGAGGLENGKLCSSL